MADISWTVPKDFKVPVVLLVQALQDFRLDIGIVFFCSSRVILITRTVVLARVPESLKLIKTHKNVKVELTMIT